MCRLTPSAYLWVLLAQGALAASSATAVATTQASALPLDGEGSSTERVVKIADLQISADGTQGFTLTVTSGNLRKADGNTPIPFQVVTVAAGAPPPTAASFTAGPGESHIYNSSSPGNTTRQLYVRYAAATLQDPGAYSASVSVLITDN